MKNIIIALIVLNISFCIINAMEEKKDEEIIPLGTIPDELWEFIKEKANLAVIPTKEQLDHTIYSCLLPQTLPIYEDRTPTFLRVTPTEQKNNEFYTTFKCKKNCHEDTYKIISPFQAPTNNNIFDGVNICKTLLYGITHHNIQEARDEYAVYILHQQNNIMGSDVIIPQQTKEYKIGYLKSLTLHHDENRYIMNVLDTNKNSLQYCISIVDIQSYDQLKPVSFLKCDISIKKCIYLGNNTYLGLTDNNTLLSLWLTENNELKYAHQKCPFKIHDIDVDRSIVTAKGFMPQIAAVAVNGKFYETNITGFEKLTWIYTNQVPKESIKMCYNQGTYSLIYSKEHPYMQRYTWESNFNIDYMYALAKQINRKKQNYMMQ